jgi:hypothetical protein
MTLDQKILRSLSSHVDRSGLSHKKVASQSGIDYFRFLRIYRGDSKPTMQEISDIAATVNTPIQQIIYEATQ